jgi:carboxyl-terminal processing protease
MRRAVAISAVVLLLGGAFFLGLFVLGRSAPESARIIPLAKGPAVPRLGLSQAERLKHEVRRVLYDSFFRPVGPEILVPESIEGIVASVGDPYADYLSPAEYASLRNRTARSYSGVGLTVGPASGGLIVTSALHGPARDAGIREGDVIVRIDGQPSGSYEQSLALIKGEPGTLVRLTVRRPDEGVIRFTVIRRPIDTPSLRSRMISVRKTKIGYVRLLSFPASAADRLEEATGALIRKGAQAMIIDLRGNPGGLFGQAVRSVSLFVGEGVVCTIEGEHQARRVYEVSGSARYPTVPLAVIVDRLSASAAEIVAAALGDHRRAVVVGERTYGKTSIQSVAVFSDGSALKLTTATYRTPSGADIVGRGVEPGVDAVDDPLTPYDEAVVGAEGAVLDALRAQVVRDLK